MPVETATAPAAPAAKQSAPIPSRALPETCGPSRAGAGGRSRPARGTSASARTHCRSPATRCRCCSPSTRSTGRSSALRLFHTQVIFMLGPEANHFITVSHPENFHWREGSFGDLIPLLGDGLLTIDDDYHDRAREIMMPAFHREQVAAAVEAMAIEAEAAIATLQPGRGRRHLRLDARAGDADRDAGPARARSRRRRQGRRRGRALRAGARLLRHRLPPAPAARPGLALVEDGRFARGARRDRLRRDRPPPRQPGLRQRRTSSASCSASGTRRARASPTARSATR